ncbi:hypothetical protein [Pseudomonas oryzihabitans]|uniref:hypothetical protein n=1 Tax=Pseudomonas oryzihabitans TaxID=47885 RepID=UPI0011A7463E|nr:hypothetical protein [Pseudomonas oryzihabitans]QEU01941.1 hypothetical protein FOB65_00975 [Pseudomonas oryzihabitans]
MSVFSTLTEMLRRVAHALGPHLCQQMTFVGGCTTGLLLTDDYTREQVRSTDDVDLIVHVMGVIGFTKLREQLREQGFSEYPPSGDEDVPICSMRLGELRVDFMPDDESLGFSNRWYKAAMATSTQYQLDESTAIMLVSPVYFIATKLEAWKGRGNGDALASRDIEDVLNLVDGREELMGEVQAADEAVQDYIAMEIATLFADRNFQDAVSSQSRGDTDREGLIWERLETLAQGRR